MATPDGEVIPEIRANRIDYFTVDGTLHDIMGPHNWLIFEAQKNGAKPQGYNREAATTLAKNQNVRVCYCTFAN